MPSHTHRHITNFRETQIIVSICLGLGKRICIVLAKFADTTEQHCTKEAPRAGINGTKDLLQARPVQL